MGRPAIPSLLHRLAAREDPRRTAKVPHLLSGILLRATSAGVDGLAGSSFGARSTWPYRAASCPTGTAGLRPAAMPSAAAWPWGIGVRPHRLLDVVVPEGGLTRLRTGHGPANMALARHVAVNLLRQAGPTTNLRTAASAPAGTSRAPQASSGGSRERRSPRSPRRHTPRD